MSDTIKLAIIFIICGLVFLWVAYMLREVRARRRWVQRIAEERRREMRLRMEREQAAAIKKSFTAASATRMPTPPVRKAVKQTEDTAPRRQLDDSPAPWPNTPFQQSYSAEVDTDRWSGGGGSSGGAGASGSWDGGSSSSSGDSGSSSSSGGDS